MSLVLTDNGHLTYDGNFVSSYESEFSYTIPTLKRSPQLDYGAILHVNTVDVYHKTSYLYSVRGNSRDTEGICVFEIFDDVFAISKYHGYLSLCNIENGRDIAHEFNDGKFFENYQSYGNFLLVEGRYTNGASYVFLYKISEFLMTPEYEPVKLFVQYERLRLREGCIVLYPQCRFEKYCALEKVYKYPDLFHDVFYDIGISINIFNKSFIDSVLYNIVFRDDYFNNYKISFEMDTKKTLKQILSSGKFIYICNGQRDFAKNLVKVIPKKLLKKYDTRMNFILYELIFGNEPRDLCIDSYQIEIVLMRSIKMKFSQRFKEVDNNKFSADENYPCIIEVTSA